MISSTEGLPVRYSLYTPAYNGNRSLPVILFLHGFKGFKDWGPFPAVCRELSRSGFAVVAINFSLNGIGDNPEGHDREDLFERETLSQDLMDTGSVLEAIRDESIKSSRVRLDSDRTGIVGHSRGGHTAIAAAAEYPDIKCLVTWNSVADYSTRFTPGMQEDFRNRGYTEILNSRTGQKMKLNRVVRDDLQDNRGSLIALTRVKQIQVPSLFIAASDDETVPVNDSQELYKNCAANAKKLHLISDTGHTFGASHPFEGDDIPGKLLEAVNRSGEWFLEHLAASDKSSHNTW